MPDRLSSPRIAAPRFAYTPCVRSGSMAFVSGMVALDPASGQLVDGGVQIQTRRILDNLELALPDYGLTLDELCIVRVYLADFGTFAQFNVAWSEFFQGRALPARTSMGVTGLPLGAAVEMEFTFVTAPA